MLNNFKAGFSLNQMSANVLNKIQQASESMPRGGNALQTKSTFAANNIIMGFNSTRNELNYGDIVAIDEQIYGETGPPARMAARTALNNGSKVAPALFNFVRPDFQTPEPDEETGETIWPYPEQALGVVCGFKTVGLYEIAYAMIYGLATVKVQITDPGEDEEGEPREAYRWATFLHEDTTQLISAPVGPARMIARHAKKQGEETTETWEVWFPSGSHDASNGEGDGEGGGTNPSTVVRALELGKATQISADRRSVLVQQVRWNENSGKFVKYGEGTQAATIFAIDDAMLEE